MAWVPKVRRHVAVYVLKTVAGNANYVKRRPGVITGIATDGAPIIRVRHTGETYGTAAVGVPRNTTLLPPRTPVKYSSV